MVLLGIIKAFNTYNKVKILKDTLDVLTKKKVNKVDKLLSYIPGLPGRLAREAKYIHDKKHEFDSRIVRNIAALSHLQETTYNLSKRYNNYYYYNSNRFVNNILKAQTAKENILKDEFKSMFYSKLKSLIPYRGTYLTTKTLAKAIADKKNIYEIAKKMGGLIGRLGYRGFSKMFAEIDRFNMIWATSDGFWRSISSNHSAIHPLLNASGGNKILRILQYKDKLTDKLWDRPFWFNVKSQETGNFNQSEHEYNCILRTYKMPIRGWWGKYVKTYTFNDWSLVSICYIIVIGPDFGYHYWRNFATLEARKWAKIYG